MARASVADLDFRDGFVTLHERNKSRETKTTRRVPMSGRRMDSPKRRRRMRLAHCRSSLTDSAYRC